jgi:general secretion pathway protein G
MSTRSPARPAPARAIPVAIARRARAAVRGFTLIEMLVALAIVALLLTLALPRYFGGLDRSRESVLRENLRVTREAIDRHFADRGRYPDSLRELVERRYLRAEPIDPLTGSARSWIVMPPEPADAGGVRDLRSAAPGRDSHGRDYASY